jgi:nucleotide-binding universal stress UspA family protein
MRFKRAAKPGAVVLESNPKDQAILPETSTAPRGADPAGRSPFRLGRVLVPLDFSSCSMKSLDYAVAFAGYFDAALILVHVVPVSYAIGEFGAMDFSLLESEMRANAEKQMAEFKARLGDAIPVETVVRLGRPVLEIVEAARSLEADLIIISTHGHTGLKHVLLGSVAENVVRYAPCPVLTVREHEHEFLAPKGAG